MIRKDRRSSSQTRHGHRQRRHRHRAAEFRRERALMKKGVWPVAGCDEAGRGPLAGPVVAAAVILDPERIPEGHGRFQEADAREARGTVRANLRDRVWCRSLSRRRRGSIATISCAHRCGRWRARCARCRKRRSMCLSMAATASIRHCECAAVIGGDGLVLSIAAASIVAKVSRDRLMCRLAQEHPEYGFRSPYGLWSSASISTRWTGSVRRSIIAVFLRRSMAARMKHEGIAIGRPASTCDRGEHRREFRRAHGLVA